MDRIGAAGGAPDPPVGMAWRLPPFTSKKAWARSRGKESPRPGHAAPWGGAAAVNLAPSPRTFGEAEPSRGTSSSQQDEHRGLDPQQSR